MKTKTSIKAGMNDPSAENCENLGGEFIIARANNGNEYGLCDIPGAGTYDAWSLMRGECTPPLFTAK